MVDTSIIIAKIDSSYNMVRKTIESNIFFCLNVLNIINVYQY